PSQHLRLRSLSLRQPPLASPHPRRPNQLQKWQLAPSPPLLLPSLPPRLQQNPHPLLVLKSQHRARVQSLPPKRSPTVLRLQLRPLLRLSRRNLRQKPLQRKQRKILQPRRHEPTNCTSCPLITSASGIAHLGC
ncbi:hypothetical protein PHLGIDRAFT_126352, partial [Phlebiopsis gigantea 11061_1 CR5-6]